MWFRLPVPYNGGLDPAGTRRKFVSLKFGNAGYGIPKVKDGSGRIWHSLFSTCQSNMMAGVMTSLVMSYLRIEPTVTLDSDSRFPRYALFMFALGSVLDSQGTHPPTSCMGEGRRVAEAEHGNRGDGVTWRGHGVNRALASSAEDQWRTARAARSCSRKEDKEGRMC